MTQREEFENAFRGYNLERSKSDSEKYGDRVSQRMWKAYLEGLQASKAQAVPQWISVSERLPEYGVPVIISVSGETKYSAYMLCCTDGSGDWFEEINGIGPDFTQVEDVDAWMPWPLPASPVVSSEMEYTTN